MRTGLAHHLFAHRINRAFFVAFSRMRLTSTGRHSGWYQTHIMISTGTPDRAVAKTAGAEIAANMEREFKALRDGPKALTAKHVSTLSGIAYRAFAEGLVNQLFSIELKDCSPSSFYSPKIALPSIQRADLICFGSQELVEPRTVDPLKL
jgi:hypothetical protein